MLKFESLAQIGDTIRAYDFKPCGDRADSFVEGVVTAKGQVPASFGGYDAFTITCMKDGAAENHGGHSRIGEQVFVPFQVSFLEWDGRVTLIKTAAEQAAASRGVTATSPLAVNHGRVLRRHFGIESFPVDAVTINPFTGRVEVKLSFFYRHGMTHEKWADSVKRKLPEGYRVFGHYEQYRQWPATSYFIAEVVPITADVSVAEAAGECEAERRANL